MVIFSGSLGADTGTGTGTSEALSEPTSQVELMKLDGTLARKRMAIGDFRAIKVSLNIANGKFIGGIRRMQNDNGKFQNCELVDFSASSADDLEAQKARAYTAKMLHTVPQNRQVVFRLKGSREDGLLEMETYDQAKHLISISTRDIKSGFETRIAFFDQDGNLTGYNRSFELEIHPKSIFNCDNKMETMKNYEYRDKKADLDALDAVLERFVKATEKDVRLDRHSE